MKCPKCQYENPEGAKFCRDCGTSLEKDIICPNCGSSHPPGSKYCIDCGHDLSKPKEAPLLDYTEPQSYTPKFLADKILTTRSSIEGERKLVTVFFADVANYTSISEKLDPEEVHQIMDGAFKVLMDEIHKYEGTINQFTGDGVMALFGAPVAHEDHAQRACYTALSVQKAVREYGEKVKKETGVDFAMRIGLNSGHVIVGSIGDDLRMDYTAVGDTTNLAARLEGIAEPGAVLVSRNTHRLARDFFEFESLGKIEVKGKQEPQETYKLIKVGEIDTRIRASVAKGLTRFIGRKDSMGALMEAYDRAENGTGQVVGIVGEAGVGKSRFLLEMRNRIPPGGYTYLEGRCIHFGGSMAYLPILNILRDFFEIKEEDGEIIVNKKMEEKILDLDEKIKGVLPPFQGLLSLKMDDEAFTKLEPKEKRERIFEALRDLMIRVSQEKPLVLAVEDLHWIDKTSEEFLDYLIGWMANTPILLILLYRPEYTHQWGSKSYYTKIGLDQLGTASSSELVQAMLEEGEVAAELKELILNRAAGNPLFMEEFTHSLLENGTIQKKDQQFVLGTKTSDIRVPDTIQAIIAARMDRLEDNLKRTMQVASVIGRDFAFRILQTITEMREELKSNLLNLQGLEFIYEKTLFPELEYIFKHALTQEVAYNSLLLARRKETHEKIGNAIEELFPSRLEEFYEVLAHHFEKADVPEKALDYLYQAGNRAVQLSANTEAIEFFRRGLKLLEGLPQTQEKNKLELRLQLSLTGPLIAIKGHGTPEMNQAFDRARQLAEQTGETSEIYRLMYGKYATHIMQAENLEALEEGKRFLSIAQKGSEEAMVMIGSRIVGMIFTMMGQFHAARANLENALALYNPQLHKPLAFSFGQNPKTTAQLVLSWGLWALGFSETALNYAKEAQLYAQKTNHPNTYGQALFYSFITHQCAGDIESAEEITKSLKDYSSEHKLAMWLICANFCEGWMFVQNGEPGKGVQHIKKILVDYQRAGVKYMLTFIWSLLLDGYLAFGEVNEGLKIANEATEFVHETDERFWEAEIHRQKGELLQMKGAEEEAETSFKKAISVAQDQEAKSWELKATISLSRLLPSQGKKEEARQVLSEIYAWFTEGFDTADLKEAKTLLDELS